MSDDFQSEAGSTRVNHPRPIYLVVCPVSSTEDEAYKPVAHTLPSGVDDPAVSFDPELVPILPAVWYALHLPSTRFDTVDIPYMSAIRDQLREKRRHLIFPVPAYAIQNPMMLAGLTRLGEPMLIISDDDNFTAATAASRDGGFALPPVRVRDLNAAMLKSHWQTISDLWKPDFPHGVSLDPRPPEWSPTIAPNGSALALRRLLKAIERTGAPTWTHDASFYDGAINLLNWRAFLDTMANLEDDGHSIADAGEVVDVELAQAARNLNVPLTLGMPGVAPRYRRLVGRLAQETRTASPTLATQPTATPAGTAPGDPPDVLRLLVAHNTAGDNSVGVITDPIPDAAFLALADLERYWIDSARSNRGITPAKEARLRAKLDEAMRPFFTSRFNNILRTASRIDAFTNFPIGLVRLPGHSTPLAALVPIAYRPINPLTRAFQIEFIPDHPIDLSEGMRILVVECIPATDPVGVASRQAWTSAAAHLTDPARSMSVDIVDASTPADVANAIAAHRPEVLVLSAHGVYDADANMAGLAIGEDHSTGDDLGPMPPLVILSACHSGPRGAGPVAVADLLVRAGARAVLSTLVPVGVHHNSVFMTRLLANMSEAIAGTIPQTTFMDVWRRVQTNNVITDIIYGNGKLMEWAASASTGTPPIEEFMGRRSAGRLRSTHLYEDAEAILLEIADERGQKARVQGWLRTPGYVPESMMYTIVGDPSSIRFQPSTVVAIHRGS